MHKYTMDSLDSLTSEKADSVSTVLMESYILVQKAYYASTPTTL